MSAFTSARQIAAAFSDLGERSEEELRLGREAGELACNASGRDDIVGRVWAPPADKHEADACFVPALAEMLISMSGELFADLDVEDTWLTDDFGRSLSPVLTGAIYHEASHAAHTQFPTDQGLDQLEWASWVILEESRCENMRLREHPEYRVFIRACIEQLMFHTPMARKGAEGPFSGIWGAANAAALIMARVDTGVLTEAEAAAVREKVIECLGEDAYDEIRAAWNDNNSYAEDNIGAQASAARRFAAAIREQVEEAGEGEGIGESVDDMLDEMAEDGIGSGSGRDPKPVVTVTDDERTEEEKLPSGETEIAEPESGDHAMSAAGAIKKLAEEVAESGKREATEAVWSRAGRDPEADAASAAERASARREAARAEAYAKSVFGEGAADKQGCIVGRRNPTDDERRAANIIGLELDKAKYRDRLMVRSAAMAPPGRLKGRGAVLYAKQRGNHEMITATPWRRAQRRHVDETPLTLGIMVDVSGSMGSATRPIASAGWIMAAAGSRIQANVASVAFGDDVTAMVKPGENPRQVTEFSAHGGSERWKNGFTAIQGALGLLGGQGARLLVVASDNGFVTTADDRHRRAILPQLLDDGVAVLWIHFGGGGFYWDGIPAGTEIVNLGYSPDLTAAAKIIGAAARAAIEKASR